MKQFNKQIKITVELDTIAQALLSKFSIEEKHSEIIVEAIIGRYSANNDEMGMTALFNALNGFNNDINFKVGDIIDCSKTVYAFWTADSIKNDCTILNSIGSCEIIEIDTYRDDKIRIKYLAPNRNGKLIENLLWVNQKYCNKIVTQPIPMQELL